MAKADFVKHQRIHLYQMFNGRLTEKLPSVMAEAEVRTNEGNNEMTSLVAKFKDLLALFDNKTPYGGTALDKSRLERPIEVKPDCKRRPTPWGELSPLEIK